MTELCGNVRLCLRVCKRPEIYMLCVDVFYDMQMDNLIYSCLPLLHK